MLFKLCLVGLLLSHLHFFALSSEGEDGEYELVWEENFDTLDWNRWTSYSRMCTGLQVYTPSAENAYTRNSTLFIKPALLNSATNPATNIQFGNNFLKDGVLKLEDFEAQCHLECIKEKEAIPPVLSSSLQSHFRFRYGRVEVVAQLPAGDWLVPGIALIPSDPIYGQWPASGEIILATSRGNRSPINGSGPAEVDYSHMLLFWGLDYSTVHYRETMKINLNHTHNFADYFHKYSLDWSEKGMTFSLDDVDVLSVIPPPGGFWEWGYDRKSHDENPWEKGSWMAPFDQEFQFHLWVSVGDHLFPDGTRTPWQKPGKQSHIAFWDAKDQWLASWDEEASALKIQSLKVYQLKDKDITGSYTILGVVLGVILVFLAVVGVILYCFCRTSRDNVVRDFHPDGEDYMIGGQEAPVPNPNHRENLPHELQQSMGSNSSYEAPVRRNTLYQNHIYAEIID